MGFSALYPRYKGGRPPKFTLAQRREIKKIAKSRPAEHDLPFSTWSLSKLAEFLVAEGVDGDISHEGLRMLVREEGVTFQRLKTWKTGKDPDYAAKKARVEHLYAIADREVTPDTGEPEIVFCMDEFGPLNLQPQPGRQWAAVSGKKKEPGRAPRPRLRATYTRTAGVRHLFAAAYELGEDKLFGHIKPRKTRGRFLEFCRYLRSLYPADVRIAIVCDNYSPHLTTAKDCRVAAWATASNVEIASSATTGNICPARSFSWPTAGTSNADYERPHQDHEVPWSARRAPGGAAAGPTASPERRKPQACGAPRGPAVPPGAGGSVRRPAAHRPSQPSRRIGG